MTIERISLTEVRAHDFIYTFDSSDAAVGFLDCLAAHDLDECEARFQAVDKRRVRRDPDDFLPGA
jgi:hypothetical protein